MRDVGSLINNVLRYKNRYIKKQISFVTKKFSSNEVNAFLCFLSYVHYDSESIDTYKFLKLKNMDIEDLRDILDNEGFAYIDNIESIYKKAFEFVFKGSEFFSPFKKDINEKIIENLIPVTKDIKVYEPFIKNISDCDSSVLKTLIIGGSASGKTTLIKNLIGFEDDNILAISNANTTIGSLKIVSIPKTKDLRFTATFKNRGQFYERARQMIPSILEEFVELYDSFDISIESDREMARKKIYDVIVSFAESTWNTAYFISFDDITYDFIDLLFDVSKVSLKLFYNKVVEEELKELYYNDLIKKKPFYELDFLQFIEEFKGDICIKGENGIDSIMSYLYNIQFTSMVNILNNLIAEFNRDEYEDRELRVIFEEKYFVIDRFNPLDKICCDDLALNMISYKTIASSMESFKKVFEFISSNKLFSNLFSVVEEIRILGDFKPSGICDEANESNNICIIEDTEGLRDWGSEKFVSMKFQDMIAGSDKVIMTYAASGVDGKDDFTRCISNIMNVGGLYKTRICFTKADLINIESSEDSSDDIVIDGQHRLKAIISDYIMNCFNDVKEINAFDFVREIMDEKSFITKNLMSVDIKFDIIKRSLGHMIDVVGREKVIEGLIENKDMSVIYDMYSWMNERYDNLEAKEILNSKSFDVRAGVLSVAAYQKQNEFVKDFKDLFFFYPWQSLKAFNIRMAYNFDYREWRGVRPEGYLNFAVKKTLRGYFRKYWLPELLDFEIDVCKNYLDFVIDSYSSVIKKKIETVMYDELLEDCWKIGYAYSGQGSSTDRENLIISSMRKKFYMGDDDFSDNNILYDAIMGIFDEEVNKEFKNINLKLKYRN